MAALFRANTAAGNGPFSVIKICGGKVRHLVSCAIALAIFACANSSNAQQIIVKGDKRSIPDQFWAELATDIGKLAPQPSPAATNMNQPRTYDFQITKDKAPVYEGAGASRKTIESLNTGQAVEVVDRVGDQYAIFAKNPKGKVVSGWVEASDVKPAPAPDSLRSSATELIVQKLGQLYQKYKNNPYVSVTGFSVQIGIPPSVTIEFTPKDTSP